MRDVSRRIRTMEKKLNVGNDRVKPKPIVICSAKPDEAECALPENIEEWITYKEYYQKNPKNSVMILISYKEVEAREQLKAAKRQGNEYKKTN